MDKVWWGQITKARYFISEVTRAALAGKSVSLYLPERLPWYQTMVDMVEHILNTENPRNSLEQFSCPEEEPGKFLFERYCSREQQSGYRYGVSYGAFLGRKEDIVLNDRYIWVKDIPESRYQQWIDFVIDYNKNILPLKSTAIFILETRDERQLKKAGKGIVKLSFDKTVDAYDRAAFCALSATETQCSEYLRPYLAELAANICQEDVELAAQCVRKGTSFLKDPVGVLKVIVSSQRRSDDALFELPCASGVLRKRIWESQVKMVFPVVESYRSRFVERFFADIKLCLPMTTFFGESVNHPQDVELGTLVYMAGSGKLILPANEYAKLRLFREARNKIAHLTILEFEMLETLLCYRT